MKFLIKQNFLKKNYLTKVILLALISCLSGKLALFLAVPPGYATAIWPPAGLAVSALLIWGRNLWPGVFWGSVAVNLWNAHYLDNNFTLLYALVRSFCLASGSTVQAIVAVSLLKRFVGYPTTLSENREIGLFYLIAGPLCCLIAATWGVTTLWILGTMSGTYYLSNWLYWWVGDVIGVLTFAPLVLIWKGEPREIWKQRKISVGVPLVAASILAILVFFAAELIRSDVYVGVYREIGSYLLLAMALIIASLLGVLLLAITGRTVTVEKIVKQKIGEIRDINLFLDSVIENLPVMLFVKDTENLRFIRFNKAGETLTGYNREELIGKNDYDLFPIEQAKFFTNKDREVINNKQLLSIDREVIKAKDGNYKWLHTYKVPILNEKNEVTYLLGISEDITEEVHLENELLEKNLALEVALKKATEASEAKGEFLRNMSHEIRTPLNGVIGLIDLVLEDFDPETNRENLELSRISASHLLSLINDILDFSKIESGKIELEKVQFDLPECIADAIAICQTLVNNKSQTLFLNASDNLPKFVIGDPTRLKQIIINLLSNAIKFTATFGGIIIKVNNELMSDGRNQIQFAVADTGEGIKEEKKTKIFEQFSQADSSTTRLHGGTGLGLSITSRLVEMMGGKISVDSILGVGSKFKFTIILETGKDDHVETSKNSLMSANQKTTLEFLQILVAEDNLVNQRIIRSILERAGHKVVMVQDGEEAVEQVQNNSFDLVLMDIQMPRLDGIEATKRIRLLSNKEKSKIPIIAVTAHVFEEDKKKCLAAGITSCLGKPIDRKELFSALARVMQTK